MKRLFSVMKEKLRIRIYWVMAILFILTVSGCRSTGVLCPGVGGKAQTYELSSGSKVKHDKQGRIKR
jgi:hypothetical protein